MKAFKHFLTLFFICITPLFISNCEKQESLADIDIDALPSASFNDIVDMEDGVVVFGPETYLRGKGKPEVVTKQVDIEHFEHFEETYTIVILNGGVSGGHRVSSAEVKIDGEVIFTPEEFDDKPAYLIKEILLPEQFELGVEIRGGPESSFNISIIGEFLPGHSLVGKNGGIVDYNGIKLILPPNAISNEGIVILEHKGDEPTSVPNQDLESIYDPLTLILPVEEISESIRLIIPWDSNIEDSNRLCAIAYNGSSYLPMEIYQEDGYLVIVIDRYKWEESAKKSTNFVYSSIIISVMYVIQNDPPKTELGIKSISFNETTKELDFTTATATSSSRVLLLVHGWQGEPKSWTTFREWLDDNHDYNYDEVWSFGYKSRNSISDNGKLFEEQLDEHYIDGTQIDIVAHSMGGLVSRAMIELHDGGRFINRLVTLGTPHLGSSLAMFRDYIGFTVGIDDPIGYIGYNFLTQGFQDLNSGSAFLNILNEQPKPEVHYYTIAATNDPSKGLFFGRISSQSKYLPGNDDGIVTVTSALGVPYAERPPEVINIPEGDAHREMKRDKSIYDQVIEYLYEPPNNEFDGILYGDFALTNDLYPSGCDRDQIINEVFGDAYRVAEWHDLVKFHVGIDDITVLMDGLGLTEYGSTAQINVNGRDNWSANSSRYYFFSRHNHNRPGSYLAHSNIDNYSVSLGSWWFSGRKILAVRKTF